MTSIIEVIQHYQRSIDSSQDDEARVQHLQETGVGKTVNSLRKFNGEIGVAAKALVTKWKAMVAAEEEPMDTNSQTNESDAHNDTNGDNGGTITHDEGDENHNHNNTRQQHEHRKHRSKDDTTHIEDHKSRSHSGSNSHRDTTGNFTSTSSDHLNIEKSLKNSKEKNCSTSSNSSSSHKNKQRERDKTEHKSSKDKNKERRDNEDEKYRRDDKHKLEKEQKVDLSNSSHGSSSKSKHENKHSQSTSSKDRELSNKHKKSSSKDKEGSREKFSSKNKPEHKPSTTLTTSKSSPKDPKSSERKRRLNSDNDSIDFKSPQSKGTKLHKSSINASKTDSSSPSKMADIEKTDDSFDSSMGANFDDVLGMLNMPVKKRKKHSKSPSTPGNTTSCSKKDGLSTNSSSSSSDLTTNANSTGISFPTNSSKTSTSKATTKPDMLAPTAKLEPLDPSIMLELPTISTNYKPMPLNQTVMDCVFNNSTSASSSTSSKPLRTLTDAEAIHHGISSKTMRTKIYSGIRTGQTFQVSTLFDMCIRILQKNIDALEYTGGVPFEVLKPVLERATPQQLYVFEEYNPYLMEDSDLLWQQHVSRNYRTKKRMENESWREMFIRCQDEEERKLSVLKDSIKASQKIAAAPIRKTQLAFVDSMVKPPRNILKKQEQFGTRTKLVATPAARVASLSNVTPNVAKTGDQRLKVSPTVRDHAQVSSSSIRPKKAPLMQKTLQFIRGRHKR